MADGAAVCICVLFYGDGDCYYQLAQRVLNAPMQALGANPDVEFRFGLNACGLDTTEYIESQAAKYFPRSTVLSAPVNTYKYPMMRRLFTAAPLPPVTMWFDHDSYLQPAVDATQWLARIRRQLTACSMLGSVYRGLMTDAQRAWVVAQPWSDAKTPIGVTSYATGSWWAAQSSVLEQYSWPPADLQQKGGDILLGELCKQTGLALCHFRDGININANAAGVEGAHPRTMV